MAAMWRIAELIQSCNRQVLIAVSSHFRNIGDAQVPLIGSSNLVAFDFFKLRWLLLTKGGHLQLFSYVDLHFQRLSNRGTAGFFPASSSALNLFETTGGSVFLVRWVDKLTS